MKPCRLLVGAVSNRRMIDGVARDTLRNKYTTTLANVVNCTPVLIPTVNNMDSSPSTADEIIRSITDRVDVVVLTGDESNIQPHLYGETTEGVKTDPSRDYVALGLIGACIEKRKPLLGICRGIQEINVKFGGTLYQNLAGEGRNHIEDTSLPRDDQYRPVHSVELMAGGMLNSWYNRKSIKVNSLHNQGIRRLGRGLQIEAVAEDGLVEAVSYREEGNLILGIQWHPEWHADNEQDASTLLIRFFAAVRKRLEKRGNSID